MLSHLQAGETDVFLTRGQNRGYVPVVAKSRKDVTARRDRDGPPATNRSFPLGSFVARRGYARCDRALVGETT